MKKETNKLHELIHSMSMNEKRYFKIAASGKSTGKKNYYLLLFNIIAGQKKYNEIEIRNKFNTRAQKDLPVIKNYLYSMILKKLRNYNASANIEIQLYDQLNEAFILFQKGLYVHYKQILKKIKTTAHKYDKLEILLEIYNRELKLIHFNEDLSAMKNEYETLIKESSEIIKKINTRNQYFGLKNKMYLLLRKTGRSKNQQVENQYNRLMQNPLLSNADINLSPESRLCFYEIQSTYYVFGEINLLKAIHALESKYQLLQSLPGKNLENIISCAGTLANLALVYYESKKIKKSFELIQQIEHHLKEWKKIVPSHIYFRILFTKHNLKTTFLFAIGDFKEGLQELGYEEKLLPSFDTVNNIHYFYYRKAQAYFTLKQFSASLLCINTLLNSSTLKEQDKFYRNTKLLQLLLYVEMQKGYLINHEVLAVKRYFKINGYLSKAEKLVFDFVLNVLTSFPSQDILKEKCSAIKKQIKNIMNDSHEKIAIEELDILSWLDSKIENRPFADIVREKALKEYGIPHF